MWEGIKNALTASYLTSSLDLQLNVFATISIKINFRFYWTGLLGFIKLLIKLIGVIMALWSDGIVHSPYMITCIYIYSLFTESYDFILLINKIFCTYSTVPIVPPLPPVVISPPRIDIPPWRPFEFTCTSPDGSRVDSVFKDDRMPVDQDPRFQVNRYNNSALIVRAPNGLRDTDDLRIEYVSFFKIFYLIAQDSI